MSTKTPASHATASEPQPTMVAEQANGLPTPDTIGPWHWHKTSLLWFMFDVIALLAMLLSISLVIIQSQPQSHMAFKPVLRALGGDHVLHIVVGALLPLTLLILTRLWRRSRRLQLCFFCLFPLGYSADELLQSLMPHRSSNWQDLAFSLIGYTLVLICWLMLVSLSKHSASKYHEDVSGDALDRRVR